jgi:hypothetical protein
VTERTKRPGFRKVVAKAASTWTSLGVAGSALVAAAALGSWPILAIGGVAYAALVGWDLANPDFWKRALGQGAPEAAKLPDPAHIADAELATAVRKVLQARGELGRVLGETPADIQANLAGAIVQIAELERHVGLLVARGVDLGKYLATVDAQALKAEVVALDAKVKAARDPEARAQYEAARRTRQEQVRTILDIDAAKDRVQAQLATIVATLEALPAQIVRMRALDAQAMDELSGSVKDELAHMNGEVRVFEETLRSLAEVGA